MNARQPASKSSDDHDQEVAGHAVRAAREFARFAEIARAKHGSDVPVEHDTAGHAGFAEWLDRTLSDDDEREALVAYAVGAQVLELRKIRDHIIDPTTSDPFPLVRLAMTAGLDRERFLNLLLTDHRRWRAAGNVEALDSAVRHVFEDAWDRWATMEGQP